MRRKGVVKACGVPGNEMIDLVNEQRCISSIICRLLCT
jgi:hypothetical protein